MLFISFLSAFLVGGYEFIRSSSESLFIHHYGAEKKPYAMALVPFAMVLFIYAYGWLLSKAGSRKAILVSMVFSIFVFFAIFAGFKVEYHPTAFFLYLFREAYIVILIEQVWSFINSTLNDSEAKMYNGPIAGMGAFGPIIAAYFISRYAVTFTTENFILVAAFMLIPAFIFAWLAFGKAGEPLPSKNEKEGAKGHLHLSILKNNKTVLYIALVIFLTQAVSTVLNLRFAQLVQDSIIGKDLRTAYFGSFWMKVNIFSFLMQFFITPFLLKKVSIRIIQIIIPIVHLVNFIAIFMYPQLAFVAFGYFCFKGIDYSIFRASKEILYIPLSYDARYRAKQIADSFMYRFSKGFTALCISALSAIVFIPSAFYAGLGMAFSGLWAAFVVPMTKNRERKIERVNQE